MLFAFYENFTAYDLICKVLAAGHSVRPDDGASFSSTRTDAFERWDGKRGPSRTTDG
jgi:hypothetical protein